MRKYFFILLMIPTLLKAQEFDKWHSELNRFMCRSEAHHFDVLSKECKYCAIGMEYSQKGKCEGYPSLLGKCYGSDHYHAATLECMYCANSFVFDEDLRQCVETP